MRNDLGVTAPADRDGIVAAVAMNRSDKDVPFALKLGGAADAVGPPRSITTYCFPSGSQATCGGPECLGGRNA